MPSRPRGIMRSATSVITALALITAAGCSTTPPPEDPLKTSPNQIRLYGTDGNMANGVAALLKDYPSGLAGMKGTAPLTPISKAFKDRLATVDRNLTDYLYAGESYDATVISALAAQIAGSSDSKAIAAQITGVTNGGTKCDTPDGCLALLANGRDIAYTGISMKLGGFTDVGEPSAATYGILRFAAENTIDDNQTEFVQAGDPSAASTSKPPAATGGAKSALKIGTLLPHTGALAAVGPPMFAGVKLAIAELNAAGGVLGKHIEYVDGDDGTSADVAKTTAQRLINAGVQVIIGASGSSISEAVLPTTVAAGVVLFSPCNTAAELSTVDDKGLYFRTAPADNLQAVALKDIIMRDGVRKIMIVARGDAYGKGLSAEVKDNLLRAGLSDGDVRAIEYNADKPDFSNLADQVRAFTPEGVLIIGFEESADAYHALFQAGFTSRVV